MEEFKTFLTTSIELHLVWIVLIALVYIVVHNLQRFAVTRTLDIYLNYIPTLIHEIGHIIFNRVSGGRANDLVVVVSPAERRETSQQGFAVTQSDSRLGEAVTTFGGYVMPPLMLYLGFVAIRYQYPSLYILTLLLIFLYFVFITSRKFVPVLIVAFLGVLLYFNFTSEHVVALHTLVVVTYHFVLGVLLGEVLQSSWTIIKLTISRDAPSWDGSALRELTLLPVTLYSVIWIGINGYTVYQLIHTQLLM